MQVFRRWRCYKNIAIYHIYGDMKSNRKFYIKIWNAKVIYREKSNHNYIKFQFMAQGARVTICVYFSFIQKFYSDDRMNTIIAIHCWTMWPWCRRQEISLSHSKPVHTCEMLGELDVWRQQSSRAFSKWPCLLLQD